MEGVALDYFMNENIVTDYKLSYEFYSYLSKDKNQDTPGTYTNMMNIYQTFMDE